MTAARTNANAIHVPTFLQVTILSRKLFTCPIQSSISRCTNASDHVMLKIISPRSHCRLKLISKLAFCMRTARISKPRTHIFLSRSKLTIKSRTPNWPRRVWCICWWARLWSARPEASKVLFRGKRCCSSKAAPSNPWKRSPTRIKHVPYTHSTKCSWISRKVTRAMFAAGMRT